jgi:agmatinase
MEGLLKNDTNIHAGIRTTLSGPSDYENDGYCGFEIVEAREIDTIGIYTPLCSRYCCNRFNICYAGTDGIIKKIRDRVGTDNPVYLSIDIDTLDPACKWSSLKSATGLYSKIRTTQSHRPPVPQRLADGPRANCGLSFVAWTD